MGAHEQPNGAQIDMREERQNYKADYDAADPCNRFMRRRDHLGGTANSHLTEWQLWLIREIAWDMVRNDALIGATTERLSDALFGEGLSLCADTGDEGLDTAIQEEFKTWALDKTQCDFDREQTLDQIASLHFQTSVNAGDMFGILTDEGSIQTVEPGRCLSPGGDTHDPQELTGIVNGVKLVDGRPVGYYFTKGSPEVAFVTGDTALFDRYDENGLEIVLHSYKKDRQSLHRGVTWWHAAMVDAGMLADLDFAMVLKAQNSATITAFIETTDSGTSSPAPLGPENQVTDAAGDVNTVITLKGGSVLDLPKGKTFKFATAPVASIEGMQHIRSQVQKVGNVVHMPLILMLLDASETNFSGFRGAVDTARMSWRRMRMNHVQQFYSPVFRWWGSRNFSRMGRVATAAAASGKFFKHSWKAPAWPSIQPKDDAVTDALSLENRTNSPRGIAAKRGLDFDEVNRQTIEDNASTIELAIEAAKELNKLDATADVDWREVARWQIGKGFNKSGTLDTIDDTTSEERKKTNNQGNE